MIDNGLDEEINKSHKSYSHLTNINGVSKSKVREVLNEGEKNAETIVDLAEKMRQGSFQMRDSLKKTLSSVAVLHEYFDYTDRLEAFVDMVKKQVDELEEQVTSFENNKKKIFNIPLFSNKKQFGKPNEYKPIVIFDPVIYFPKTTTSDTPHQLTDF